MKEVAWYLKQMFPLEYKTKYHTPDGVQHYAAWRMWFGNCFAIRRS